MINQQKKMFKILCPIEKKGGGTFWQRCGTGFENRDESINVYLDVMPKDFKFQIRPFDAEDLRRMAERRGDDPLSTSSSANSPVGPLGMNSHGASARGSLVDETPF